jgi:hypothetical protein
MRPGVHEPTRLWLAERDIRSWPWEHGDRPEQSITSALRDLLEDLALALIVRDASERIVVDVVGDAPLWDTNPAPGQDPICA